MLPEIRDCPVTRVVAQGRPRGIAQAVLDRGKPKDRGRGESGDSSELLEGNHGLEEEAPSHAPGFEGVALELTEQRAPCPAMTEYDIAMPECQAECQIVLPGEQPTVQQGRTPATFECRIESCSELVHMPQE